MTATPKNRFLQSPKAWENKINPNKTQIEADFPDQTSKEIIIGPPVPQRIKNFKQI
jgi:hypothetical protein